VKIFVTGATGFIGKHLCKALVKEKHQITAFVRHGAEVKDLRILEENGINIFTDTKELKHINEYFSHNHFDGVIHLATCYIAQHDFEDIDNLVEANLSFSLKIIDAAASSGIDWFINTGTFWQHYENKKYSPGNLYSATKQAFEDLAQYYIETSDIKFVTLKLNDTYGPNDTRNKIFNLWEKTAASGDILDMSPGEQIIDIIHVFDVVSAYLSLIKFINRMAKQDLENFYAVTSEKKFNLRQLAEKYEKIIGKTLNINWGARPYRKREVMKPWNTFKLVPGWEQRVSLEEGIKNINEY
jgi:CDP-paratose synthetase